MGKPDSGDDDLRRVLLPVELDRKIMADMAVRDPEGFTKLIEMSKEQLAAA